MTTAVLTQQDIDGLYRYAVGEQIHDVALFWGISTEQAGLRLANLCGMRRDIAFQIAYTARNTR